MHKDKVSSDKPARIGSATSSPTISEIKTVNVRSPISNQMISVNAQQYCVLLTDVPLEKHINK